MTEIWKGREDVKRIKIGRSYLGHGAFGEVYAGKIWFKGQKPRRVAVKVFRPDVSRHLGEDHFSDRLVERYEQVITKLRNSNLPVAKTGFYKHEGQWVQVQELVGSVKRQKIIDIRKLSRADFKKITSEKTRSDLLKIVAKLLNHGYNPHVDSVSLVTTSQGARPLINDFDEFVHNEHVVEKVKGGKEIIIGRMTMCIDSWARLLSKKNEDIVGTLAELKKRMTHEDAVKAVEKVEKIYEERASYT